MIMNNSQNNDTEKKEATIIEQTNISRHITDFSQTAPYKKAVICLSGRDDNRKMAYSHLTFRQLNQQSDDIARGLQRSGVVRGTKTALQMTPGIQWFAVTYALLKIGAVPVLIQPSLGFRHIAQCIKAVEPEALITSPQFSMIQMMYPKYYQSVHLQINTGRNWFKKGLSLLDLQQNEPGPFQIADIRDQDHGMIVFSTSNEVDVPKPIILTHKMLNATMSLMESVLNLCSESLLLSTFPFFMILSPALGLRQIIPSLNSIQSPKIDPRMIIESIWDHGITHLLMTPTQLMVLENFLRDAGIFLHSIQRILSWGEAYPAEELQKFHYFVNNSSQVFPVYGIAEAPLVTTLGSHEIVSETQIKTERGFGLCQGKIITDMDMKIIEVSDRPIDNWSDDLMIEGSNIGELVVKGEAVSNKYANSVKADALTKIPDGKNMWHRTGDVGWIDSNGYFWFCGRKKDRIIISEDETLYTIPCEAVFMRHQRVHRCIIVGVGPVPYQTPVLIIELAPGDSGKYISTLTHELMDLAQAYPHTGNIKNILFRKRFPVHPIFHQKINRKQLTVWAAKKLGKSIPDEAPDRVSDEHSKAIYPSSLEDSDEKALSEPLMHATDPQAKPISTIDKSFSEPIVDDTFNGNVTEQKDSSFVSEQVDTYGDIDAYDAYDDIDGFQPKNQFVTRMKTALNTVKEKAKSVMTKKNSPSEYDEYDPLDNDIDDAYMSTDITAELQTASSSNDTLPFDNSQQGTTEMPQKTYSTEPDITQNNEAGGHFHNDNDMMKDKGSSV